MVVQSEGPTDDAKRARRESDTTPSSPSQMEAPLAVALSQSMDSVNTAAGEEEVSLFIVLMCCLLCSCAFFYTVIL